MEKKKECLAYELMPERMYFVVKLMKSHKVTCWSTQARTSSIHFILAALDSEDP